MNFFVARNLKRVVRKDHGLPFGDSDFQKLDHRYSIANAIIKCCDTTNELESNVLFIVLRRHVKETKEFVMEPKASADSKIEQIASDWHTYQYKGRSDLLRKAAKLVQIDEIFEIVEKLELRWLSAKLSSREKALRCLLEKPTTPRDRRTNQRK